MGASESRTRDRRVSLASLLLSGLLLVGLLLLAGCGSGGARSSANGDAATNASSTSGGAVVARVGSATITQHDLVHRMAVVATEEHLVPTDEAAYARCLAALEAAGSPTTFGAGEVASELARSRCGWANAELLRKALIYLISSDWLIEGARGVDHALSARQAEAKLGERKEAQKLSESGRTRADAVFDVEVHAASLGLEEYIDETTPAITAADVARRFRQRASLYTVPQSRDVNIVRLASEAEALKARREIQAGTSFASVASGKPTQPNGASNGRVEGLTQRTWGELKLVEAVFAAKPHTLSQPVAIPLGLYVFEVTRAHPARRLTLTEARHQIMRELALERHASAAKRFVAAWRSTWKSKTYCHAGVLIADCSESSFAPTHTSEGPYPLTSVQHGPS